MRSGRPHGWVDRRGARRVPAGDHAAAVPSRARGGDHRGPAARRRGHAPAGRGVAGGLDADAAAEVRDGWLETTWFDAPSGRRTGARPIGVDTVRVRAWADPTHPGSSKVTVETVYRPLADPRCPSGSWTGRCPATTRSRSRSARRSRTW